jgi:hypothetical protein
MKKFDKSFKVGDNVKFSLDNEIHICKIKEIHETRNWIKIDGFEGSFQRGDVKKMKNRIKDKIKNVKWHDELDGWIITLTDNRVIQIQYKKVENKLDADYNRFWPKIDKENEYGLSITEEEEKEINEYIFTNKAILNGK